MELRSPPRDVTLTIDQLGAIVAYASYDIEALRWVLGMIATAARPDAVLKWNVAKQWKGEPNFDTHPFGEPKTKKRNAVVPLIPELKPWLEAWSANPHKIVRSRKTLVADDARRLDLPENIVPKTIRHTIATQLRSRGVPMDEISGLLGHTSASTASRRAMPSMIRTTFPMQSNSLAPFGRRFVHLRTTGSRISFVSVPLTTTDFSCKESWKMRRISATFGMVGGDGLEPPTLSV
jgi:integrase